MIRLLQLLEKLYVDFSEHFDNLEKNIDSVKKEVSTNHIIRLEDEFHNKFGAL